MMSIEDIRKQEMIRVNAIISNFKTTPTQTQEVQKQEPTIVKAEWADIKKSVSDDDIQKAFDVLSSHYTDPGIVKSVAAIGEIHTWNGKKYKKQGNGKWLEVSEHEMTKKEHQVKTSELSNVHGSKAWNKHNEAASKLSDKEHSDEEVGLGEKESDKFSEYRNHLVSQGEKNKDKELIEYAKNASVTQLKKHYLSDSVYRRGEK